MEPSPAPAAAKVGQLTPTAQERVEKIAEQPQVLWKSTWGAFLGWACVGQKSQAESARGRKEGRKRGGKERVVAG